MTRRNHHGRTSSNAAVAAMTPTSPARRKRTLHDDSPSQRSPGLLSSPDRANHNLPSSVSNYLKQWMMSDEHILHPYPTELEKQQMLADTGLEMKQLNNWFVNNRKRYWKPRVQHAVEYGAAADSMGDNNKMEPPIPPPPPVAPPAQPILDFDSPLPEEEGVIENAQTLTAGYNYQKYKEAEASLPHIHVLAVGGPLRETDILSSKISCSRHHKGNVFYRTLVECYSRQVGSRMNDPYEEQRVLERIYRILTVDRNGRFLKQQGATDSGGWHEMPKEAVIRKITLAIKSGQHKHSKKVQVGVASTRSMDPMMGKKKRSKKKNLFSDNRRKRASSSSQTKRPVTKRRRKKLEPTPQVIMTFRAERGSKYIHPYTLHILTSVCNAENVSQALSLFDNPLKKKPSNDQEGGEPEKETPQERLQRLQLRHRYYAAWSGGMSPVEFTKSLLEFWDGRLIETKTTMTPAMPAEEEREPASMTDTCLQPTLSETTGDSAQSKPLSSQQPQEQELGESVAEEDIAMQTSEAGELSLDRATTQQDATQSDEYQRQDSTVSSNAPSVEQPVESMKEQDEGTSNKVSRTEE